MIPRLKLLVLRCGDVEACRLFYTAIGFVFTPEKHDSTSAHYAAISEDIVFELYPLAEDGAPDSSRLGFTVDDFGAVLKALNLPHGPEVDAISQMVVQDPDGRKIELYKISGSAKA